MAKEQFRVSASRVRKEEKREQIRSALKHVWSFLESHLHLANTHGAEFITQGHWNTFVPERSQQQLLAMSHDELLNLPECRGFLVKSSDDSDKKRETTSSDGDWLASFTDGAYRCRVENIINFSSVEDIVRSSEEQCGSGVIHAGCSVISEAMTEKKNHEVEIMSEAVVALFKYCRADAVVDVGSGKGYLGSELARHHNLPVLGLDSSNSNTHGALLRDGKLARRWRGLERRKEMKKRNQQGVDRAAKGCVSSAQRAHHESSRSDSKDSNKPEAGSDSKDSNKPEAGSDSKDSNKPEAGSDSKDSNKPEAGSDSKDSNKPEAGSDSKDSNKPEAGSDSKDSNKPEAGSDSKDSNKPEAGSDSKDSNKPEAGSDSKDSNKPEAGSDSKDSNKPEAGSDSKDSNKPEAGSDSKDSNKPEAGSDSKDSNKPEAGSDSKDSNKPEAGSDSKDSNKPEAGSDSKDSNKPEAGSDSKDSNKPEAGSDPKDSNKPEAGSDSKDSNKPEAGSDSKDSNKPEAGSDLEGVLELQQDLGQACRSCTLAGDVIHHVSSEPAASDRCSVYANRTLDSEQPDSIQSVLDHGGRQAANSKSVTDDMDITTMCQGKFVTTLSALRDCSLLDTRDEDKCEMKQKAVQDAELHVSSAAENVHQYMFHDSSETHTDYKLKADTHHKAETVSHERANTNTSHRLKTVSHQTAQTSGSHLEDGRNISNTGTCSVCLYVPVTLSVHPDMNLQQILYDHASHLGLCGSGSSNILLTGLHTCGSLSVTVMRLFLQEPAVVGLCIVGCCYQLMEESFTGDHVSFEPSSTCFPLSDFGKEMKMHLGRNARNLASQSVDRSRASGQLQGADFFWRAVLDVLLHELGVTVPERIPTRGLQKRSRSFHEYVLSSLEKLQLSPDLVTPELVASIEDKHKSSREQMAAFFQLKVALAPVIETLILLDRCLYLMEQASVSDVHIVRMFNPVTSPRCCAIVGLKTNQTS